VIDRQPRDLPLDSHLHTNLSPDSDVVIDVYAAQAVDRGIRELAITDHVDFEPGAPAYGYATFEDRERIVRGAAERWAPQGLDIRFGAELTYDRSWEDDIRRHLARHAYDFTIGSVHDRVETPYSPRHVQQWVEGRSLAEIVAPSFDEVAAAARSRLFDALGHLDVVKRYLHPFVTKEMLAAAPELYEPILQALVESGTALEINTSGLRHAVGETYPSEAMVRRFREMGGRAVTVGSDAHRAEHFGWALADGYQYAMDGGFTALTFRRGGTSVLVEIPATPLGGPNGPAGDSL
jgi:histidinol-phosphatase (PHP family)